MGFRLLREPLAWGGMSDSKGPGSWLTRAPPCVRPRQAPVLGEAEAARREPDSGPEPGARR